MAKVGAGARGAIAGGTIKSDEGADASAADVI